MNTTPQTQHSLATLVATCLVVAACSGDAGSSADGPRDNDGQSSASWVLPALAGQAECESGADVPSAEDWAAQAHTIAIGTVVEIRPAMGPWTTLLGGQSIDACDEPARYGIDIVLDDVRATAGRLGTEIVVRVTAHELANWSVLPSVTEDAVEWRDDAGVSGVGYGMRVGGFLARAAEPEFFVSIGPLFWAEDDGTLRFQRGPYQDHCPEALPAGVEEKTFEELAGDLTDATYSTPEGLDSYVDYVWARSSLCGDAPPEPLPCIEFEPGEVECPDGLTCDERTMTCR